MYIMVGIPTSNNIPKIVSKIYNERNKRGIYNWTIKE